VAETLVIVLLAWAVVNVLAAWWLSRLGSRLRRFGWDGHEALRSGVSEIREHEITR
jgi:hypothetical protein